MKVTNDDVIRTGEQELIDGITADLDWNAVEDLFAAEHRLPLGEDVSYKNGDLVVHEGRIAYLLEFEVKVPLSILLDRQGHCIQLQSRPAGEQDSDPQAGDSSEGSPGPPEEHDPPQDAPHDSEGYEQALLSVFQEEAEAADESQEPTSEEGMDAGIPRLTEEAQGRLTSMGELGKS